MGAVLWIIAISLAAMALISLFNCVRDTAFDAFRRDVEGAHDVRSAALFKEALMKAQFDTALRKTELEYATCRLYREFPPKAESP